jgi:hypothetical protein
LPISKLPKSGITNANFWGYSVKMHTINFIYFVWRIRSLQRLRDVITSLLQKLPHLFFKVIDATIAGMFITNKSVTIDKYMFRPVAISICFPCFVLAIQSDRNFIQAKIR